jgi:hypothetical protein
MTAEEKIVKIKEILRNEAGEDCSRIPREELKKEILQFTITEIIDCIADVEKMIHDIYDVIED